MMYADSKVCCMELQHAFRQIWENKHLESYYCSRNAFVEFKNQFLRKTLSCGSSDITRVTGIGNQDDSREHKGNSSWI